jgi:hypothetical protein
VHGQPRATKDLDLFVQPEEENAKAIYAALSKFERLSATLSPKI